MASGVMMAASQLGGAGSYLEPLIVRLPSPDVTIYDIQDDVMLLMYIGNGLHGQFRGLYYQSYGTLAWNAEATV